MSRDGWSSARSAIQAKAQPSLRTDRLGRPVSRSGDAFDYNPRGEVTNATISSAAYRYAYDGIGNRETAFEAGTTTAYSANNVNQYTAVGSAQPSYDADGNLVSDGTRTFVWSASGHLTQSATISRRYENAYDYLGRRVYRAEYRRVGRIWSLAEIREYVYDGWNLVHETRTASGVETDIEYFWGPDLSGSLQGAGGVGGLVAVSIDGDFYFPGYDNNGNVIGYWDESGSIVAEYAYDAFGNTISSSGSMASVFPHRFSTKYYDAETDLYYYGYRYYSPSLGRWISWDPIEEGDLFNLYSFCGNRMLFDCLGLYSHSHNCSESFLSIVSEAEQRICERLKNWIEWGKDFAQDDADNLLRKAGFEPPLAYHHSFAWFISEIVSNSRTIVSEIENNGYGIECECSCSTDRYGNPINAYVKTLLPCWMDDDIHFCPAKISDPRLNAANLGKTLVHELSHYFLGTKDVESWGMPVFSNLKEILTIADFYEDVFEKGRSNQNIEDLLVRGLRNAREAQKGKAK